MRRIFTAAMALILLAGSPQASLENIYTSVFGNRSDKADEMHQALSKLEQTLKIDNKALEIVATKMYGRLQERLDQVGYTVAVTDSIKQTLSSDPIFEKAKTQYVLTDQQYMMIKFAANKFHLPLENVLGIMAQESWGDAYAISTTGRAGDFQLSVETARALGLNVFDNEDYRQGHFLRYNTLLSKKTRDKTPEELVWIDERFTILGDYKAAELIRQLSNRYKNDWDKIFADFYLGPTAVSNPTDLDSTRIKDYRFGVQAKISALTEI
jgi:hypothetical protein